METEDEQRYHFEVALKDDNARLRAELLAAEEHRQQLLQLKEDEA